MAAPFVVQPLFMNMFDELFLTSAIPPSVNHYLAYRAIIKDGKPMAMSYCTPEAAKYKKDFSQYVAQEVIRQGYRLEPNSTRHFYVDCDFVFPRTNMDCNNYFKCMLDAITDTKLIWLDDNVVCERVNSIRYDTDDPRIEIHIQPVDYIGVFDDASHLRNFENKCIGCQRYRRNCSILKNAILGKIQKEVHGDVCEKRKEIKEN
jgi:crossover junction endodeoxyribonuclease RusA